MTKFLKVILALLIIATTTVSVNSKSLVLKTNFVKREIPTEDPPYLYDEAANASTLLQLEIIFRHGARTPLLTFPTDPNKDFDYGVKGLGQLTPRGIRMGYELGGYLRKRYDKFFATDYSSDQADLLSSDTDRTIMTGQAVLAGLFSVDCVGQSTVSDECPVKNLNWKPIPVRTIPDKLDNKLLFDAKCNRLDMLFNQTFKSSKVKTVLDQNNANIKLIKEKTGLSDVDVSTLQYLSDAFKVQVENGLTLPDWTKQLDQDALAKVVDWKFTLNTSTSTLSQLEIGPLVGHIVQNLELGMSKDSNLKKTEDSEELYNLRNAKAHFYSAHDTTISSFLNSFGLYNTGEQPVYTAALILELHQSAATTNSTNQNDPTIKLFYKNKRSEPIKELEFPKCKSPCTLTDFKTAYRNLILSESQWKKLCQNLVQKKSI